MSGIVLDGFSPTFDVVIRECGMTAAVIFGKVWRYCQMKDSVCWASQARLAEELGITRQTVNTHLGKLVEAGYLIDITPDLVGESHEYADAGKARISLGADFGGQPPVKNFDTPPVKNFDTPPVKNFDTPPVKNFDTPPVKNFDTKKQEQEQETNQETTRAALENSILAACGLTVEEPEQKITPPEPTSPPAAPLLIDILHQGDPIKNPRAHAALQRFAARQNEPDLGWLSESLRPLAKAFIEEAEFGPQPRERSGWRIFLQDLFSIQATPEEIREAIRYNRKAGLSIRGPASIFSRIRDQKVVKTKSQPHYSEVY